MKQIHWFPGHMKKAVSQITDSLKLIDLVIEVVDARAIASSRYQSLIQNTSKKSLIVLSKTDLADPTQTQIWMNHFKAQNIPVIALNLNESNAVPTLLKLINKTMTPFIEKYLKKGQHNKVIKVMILGIPNVGKSTLINRLSKKNRTTVENRPGVTRSQHWIHVSETLLVLDTPGVLPPHYDSPIQAIHLALIGSMKIEHMPLEELALFLYRFLVKHYPEKLQKKYHIPLTDSVFDFFATFAKERGWISKANPVLEKAYAQVIKDFSDGALSGVTLEPLVTWH
jgi:ribosome biogenesis GTPase A